MRLSRKLLTYTLVFFFAFTTGFGLVKQAKKSFKARASFFAGKEEPGEAAKQLRDWLFTHHGSAGAAGLTVKYLTDRPDIPGQRPGSQYCYDAQYGFVPLALLVREDAPHPDYYLLDFVTEASMKDYAASHGLCVEASSGSMGLARRET